MAVLITQGTGTTMAADVVGTATPPTTGNQIQYIKIDAGANGASLPVNATNPMPSQLTDGTNVQKSGSAANLAAKSAINAMLHVLPGQWAVTNTPAANTQATASQAAGSAGVRNVCQNISAKIAGGASAPTAGIATLNLRDGATGAGTVLMSWIFGITAVAGATVGVDLSNLNIPGTAATAMTLEFVAAGGANTYESVNMAGTTCV